MGLEFARQLAGKGYDLILVSNLEEELNAASESLRAAFPVYVTPHFQDLADPGGVASDMIDLGHWFDPLADAFFKPLCKKPADGVMPALRALESSLTVPRYYVGKGDREIPRRYLTPEKDIRLWEETELFLR